MQFDEQAKTHQSEHILPSTDGNLSRNSCEINSENSCSELANSNVNSIDQSSNEDIMKKISDDLSKLTDDQYIHDNLVNMFGIIKSNINNEIHTEITGDNDDELSEESIHDIELTSCEEDFDDNVNITDNVHLSNELHPDIYDMISKLNLSIDSDTKCPNQQNSVSQSNLIEHLIELQHDLSTTPEYMHVYYIDDYMTEYFGEYVNQNDIIELLNHMHALICANN